MDVAENAQEERVLHDFKRRYLLWGTDTVVVAVDVLPAASFAVMVIV